MSLVALILLPFLVGRAFALPLGASLGVGVGLDSTDGANGGLGVGIGGLGAGIGLGTGNAGLRAGIGGYGTGGLGSGVAGYRTWPFNTYGPWLSNDILDVANPLAYGADIYARSPVDYVYADYPRTVDFAKENFVRGSYYGGAEVGTRDEVIVRPSIVRAPYSRLYSSSSFPFNYYRGFNKFPLYGGPRGLSAGGIAGDALYLKR